MSILKSEGKASVTISRAVIDYIKSKRFLFRNELPQIGERWTVKNEFFGKRAGKDFVYIEDERGNWMRLPKDLF